MIPQLPEPTVVKGPTRVSLNPSFSYGSAPVLNAKEPQGLQKEKKKGEKKQGGKKKRTEMQPVGDTFLGNKYLSFNL